MVINVTSILIIFAFFSSILVLIGSIKLIKLKNIPGSKLIFFAVVGSILLVFLPEAEFKKGGISFFLQAIEVGVYSILMLMASYGFFRLANYTATNSTK